MRVYLPICAILTLAAPLGWSQMLKESKPLFSEDFEKPDKTGRLPVGWRHFSKLRTVHLSRKHVHGGKHSLCVVDEDRKAAVGLRSPHIKVKPGQYCWVSWHYYGETGNNQSMYIEFWTADGKRPPNRGRSWPSSGRGKWVHLTRRTKVPPGAVTATVHANSYSTNVATGYFDDVEFGMGPKGSYDRKPRPPANVKHPCGLYKPADIERAKRNIERHDWAKSMLKRFKSRAGFWMKCPDDKLSYWIPDLTPFRVVDCPKCGAGWRFAWTGNDRQIKCRNCKFTWPHPDYPETKAHTFADPVEGEQKIPYYEGKPSTIYGSAKSPVYRLSGRLRYHRIGKLGTLGSLGQVYALTGEVVCAKQVRKVLLRLAEVYPRYVPHDWRRVFEDYSNLQSGKLSGWKLHDAHAFISLATAYDLTYNSGVYSDADKVKIEEGCFREFARLMTATSPRGCCINDGPTAMAAGALSGLMLGSHDVIAWAVKPPDGFVGFLEGYFLRDGHWYEASPSYEGMSLGRLHVAPEALRGYTDPPTYTKPDRFVNLDLFTHPLMKKILVVGAYERMPDRCLPATNDSTLGAKYPRGRAEVNCFWYPTERNRRLMAWAFGGKIDATGSEYALFRRDPDLDFSNVKPLAPSSRSVVRPGAGWAILRTGDGPTDAALMLDYGPHGSGHGHPDRLNVVYYDYGKEMVTDLGYLAAGHPNHPWIRSTASHNHVIVDGKPQARLGGELEAFCGKGSVQAVIASAPKAYKGRARVYRRHLLFVSRGVGRRYVVDLFEVKGGLDHQYALHADGETFKPPGLAYANVAAKSLGDPDTGYRWLTEVKQAAAPEAFVCEWISDAKQRLGTRLHMMGKENTKLVYAKGRGLRNRRTPFAKRDMFKLYVRRPGPYNWFLSVIEVFKGKGGLSGVRALEVETGAGHASAVEVRSGEWVDIAIVADEAAAAAAGAAAGAITLPAYPKLRFSGRMGFVGLRDSAPAQLWMLSGKLLAYGDVVLRGTPKYDGKILAVDQRRCTVTVDADIPTGTGWAGEQMLVKGYSDGAYVMESIEREGGKIVIHLADEPILAFEAGDRFTIVPSAVIARRSAPPPPFGR